MAQGKHICAELKQIRRTIAEENGIALEIPECTFEGECAGTCPRCEAEMRYLENQLAKRLSLGKVATVAGLMLTLASPAAAQTDKVGNGTNNKPMPDTITTGNYNFIKCTVIDDSTLKPIPFAKIILKRGTAPESIETDFDGTFIMRQLPNEDLTVEVRCNGYYSRELNIPLDTTRLETLSIALKKDSNHKDSPQVAKMHANNFDEGTIVVENRAKRSQGNNQLRGAVAAEIQVVLGGTPASLNGDDRARQPILKTVDPQHQEK